MKLDNFINRPVLSTVISVVIVILGILGLISLPISQYPDIAPPTISVRTTYQGANAQTVLNSVIAPLEEQINGVENMDYMSSTATNTGDATITITFKQGTDPDMAAVNVQNRVAKAQGFLPAEVTKVGVITQKRQSSMLVVFSVSDTSGKYDMAFIENYAKINIIPQIQRVKGVGDVMVMGADYSMRIWLDPERMAQYGLVPTDVAGILAEQNIEAAPGAIGERENQTYQYTLRYRGRLQETEEFENLVIRSNPDGTVLRVKDVARVELGRMVYSFAGKVNGRPAVSAIVQQTAGSNATQIILDIEKLLDECKKDLPEGLEINIAQNANDFLFASIHEVVKTLIEAFILVFVVVFIFLQDMRSTLIPSIAIPVALIGTFFAINMIGFSINLLTLSAMVLAIAIVVDDAIVVVEGVHAKLDQGYSSARKASIDAMRELGGAIVSITLVMMAVFVPVSFMSGTSGVFYRQFGITMAIAIAFSAVNALTLSPALCAILLKPHHTETTLKERMDIAFKEARQNIVQKYVESIGKFLHPGAAIFLILIAIIGMIAGWFDFEGNPVTTVVMIAISVVALIGISTRKFKDAFNNFFENMLKGYKKNVLKFIQRPILTLSIVVVSIVAMIWLMAKTPTSLVPIEDQGTLMAAVTMPPGTSQDKTEAMLDKVDSLIRSIPAVESSTMISGFGLTGGQGPSYGSFIIKLKDWNERPNMEDKSLMICIKLSKLAPSLFKGAQVLFFPPPMIPGYGMSSGFTFNLQDRTGGDINKFFEVSQDFLAELQKRPEIESAQTTFNPNFPEYLIDIDAAKCKRAGISPSEILMTLQGYYGGLYSSNFNRFGKLYRVMVQGARSERTDFESLYKIKVRNSKGGMAPITEFISITPSFGPDNINRFNMYTSLAVNGNPATGYTSGQAIQAINEVAATHLPQGYSFEYSGQTREESTGGSTTAFVFILCFVFIYLLLSAQYESYILPFAVLLSIPFGLFGSFAFIYSKGELIKAIMGMGGPDNNIYVQIALIMLIGLLAKNAILIVEFALERRRMGMSISWAAVLGAGARLRPILMTSFALIIGLLPLMFAAGVGAQGNQSLGTTAIGGMLIGMIFQIFLVPALFVIFQYLQEKVKPMEWEDINNSEATADIEQYSK
ncbi:MAG: efflux RND transporter permease subunit [Bacteroidaceae bacterium]|nr:efflux RND transporter permease subunit [Bacteroidaceae bacterium]